MKSGKLDLLLRSEASAAIKGGADQAKVELAYDALLALRASVINLDAAAYDECRRKPDPKLERFGNSAELASWLAAVEQEHVGTVVRGHVETFLATLREAGQAFGLVVHQARPEAPVEFDGKTSCSYAEIVTSGADGRYYAMLEAAAPDALVKALQGGKGLTYRELGTKKVMAAWPAVAAALAPEKFRENAADEDRQAPRRRKFLEWHETIGAETQGSPREIEQKWRQLSDGERAAICPGKPQKIGLDTVNRDLRLARAEREKGGRSNRPAK